MTTRDDGNTVTNLRPRAGKDLGLTWGLHKELTTCTLEVCANFADLVWKVC